MIFATISAVLGLLLGVAYEECVRRYVYESPLWTPPRPACPECGRAHGWRELLPVAGWFVMRGRCAGCGTRLPGRRVALELCSGAWAALLALRFGPSAAWAVYMVFGGALLVASFVDFELFILPDRINLPGIPAAVLCHTFVLGGGGWGANLQASLLGAAAGGGAFWVMQRLYRLVRDAEGVGTGDVKLMFLLGALLGVGMLPLMVCIAALSSLAGSLFYIFRGRAGMQTRIPFGPFLSFGAMACILYGGRLWTWYLGAGG